jgi:hypothetical protein
VGAARKEPPERHVADGASAGKQLLRLDPRFESLLWLTKDLDAAAEQLAWDYEYLRWFAAFQEAARRIPAVPRMSVTALAFLKRLAAQGDADAQRKLDAFERARLISDEAEISRRVSLAEARAMPRALGDRRIMMGVVALQGAHRLRLALEPRHYLLLGIWTGLERPVAGRRAWEAALRRWSRQVGTIEAAVERLDRALHAQARRATERPARRAPPTSE